LTELELLDYRVHGVFLLFVALGESVSCTVLSRQREQTGLAECVGGYGNRTRYRPKQLKQKSKSWKQGQTPLPASAISYA
jgi:hypothetical protein